MFSGFMVNTWAAATIVAVIAGVVGFFVVLRGAAFPAHAIPNGAFAGAAGAELIGANTLLGLAVFAVAAALGVGALSRRGRHDVATALALVVLLALGAVFLSRSDAYEPQVYALLFGEILGVSSTDLLPVIGLAAASVLAVAVLYRPLLLASALPDVAEARGVRRVTMETAFLVLLAVATSLTVPVVGALLIFTLMIGPPAAARSFTRRPAAAMALGTVLALATVWLSIAAAWWTDWPVGFYVGAFGAGCYAAGRIWAASVARAGRRGTSRAAAAAPTEATARAANP